MRNIPTQKKNRKKTSRIQGTEENEKEKGKSCYPSPSPNIYHPLGFTPLFVGCFSMLHIRLAVFQWKNTQRWRSHIPEVAV